LESGQMVEPVENGRMEVKCLKKMVVEGVSFNYWTLYHIQWGSWRFGFYY